MGENIFISYIWLVDNNAGYIKIQNLSMRKVRWGKEMNTQTSQEGTQISSQYIKNLHLWLLGKYKLNQHFGYLHIPVRNDYI